MESNDIKQSVREHYGKIAVERSGCCESTCGCGDTTTVTISPAGSYTGADGEILDVADYGLGCGNPTAFADLAPGMTVLDLGSGAGIDVFLAARQVGDSGRAIGLDMTDAMLARAEENRLKLGITNAEFRKGEIEDMPVDAGSVDRVLSNCVINLVPDKRKAFAEIYRVLKPGGGFTISDIVTEGSVPDYDRLNSDLWCACVSGALSKEEYLDTIRSAGFTDVVIRREAEYPVNPPASYRVLSITVTARKR
jgi:ubiquinone/menaquinone biosynthesis C-methylase UbiE